MRLIDADKIKFSEIDEIGGEYEPYLGCSKRQIDNLPTVEAIPIIKCNICKYYTKMEGCLNDRCERFKDTTHPYCYCYWGKEKGADRWK